MERMLSVRPESTLLFMCMSTSIPLAQGKKHETPQPVPRGEETSLYDMRGGNDMQRNPLGVEGSGALPPGT